jgi:hypothetical protein
LPDVVAMSKLSLMPSGAATSPVPSLPNTPTTSAPASTLTDGAVIDAVFAAKRPLVASTGATVSRPPKARIAPAAKRDFVKRHV